MVQPPLGISGQQPSEFQKQRRVELGLDKAPEGIGFPEKLFGNRIGGAIRGAVEPVAKFATTPLLPESTFENLPTPLRVGGEAVANLTSPLGLGLTGASLFAGGAPLAGRAALAGRGSLLAAEGAGSLAAEVTEEAGAPAPVQLAAGIAAGAITANPAKFARTFRELVRTHGRKAADEAFGGASNAADHLSLGLLPEKAPKNHKPVVYAYADDPFSDNFVRYGNSKFTPADYEREHGRYIYHVTAAAGPVFQDGIIRSAVRARMGGSTGLGSAGPYVSVSSSPEPSMNIARQFSRNIEVAKRLVTKTGATPNAERLFYKKIMEYIDGDIDAAVSYAEKKSRMGDANIQLLIDELESTRDHLFGTSPQELIDKITRQAGAMPNPTGAGSFTLMDKIKNDGAEALHGQLSSWDDEMKWASEKYGLLTDAGHTIFTGNAVWTTARRSREMWYRQLAERKVSDPRIVRIDVRELDPGTLITEGFDIQNLEMEVWQDIPVRTKGTDTKILMGDFEKWLASGAESTTAANVAQIIRANPSLKQSSIIRNFGDDLAFNNPDSIVLGKADTMQGEGIQVMSAEGLMDYSLSTKGPNQVHIDDIHLLRGPEDLEELIADHSGVAGHFEKSVRSKKQIANLDTALRKRSMTLNGEGDASGINRLKHDIQSRMEEWKQAADRHGTTLTVDINSLNLSLPPEVLSEIPDVMAGLGFTQGPGAASTMPFWYYRPSASTTLQQGPVVPRLSFNRYDPKTRIFPQKQSLR